MPILLVFTAPVAAGPGFHARVTPLSSAQRTRMTGVSWHRGCPVPLARLRLLTLSYVGFDGDVHTGHLVANADAANALVGAFRRLYDARVPIRRMEPVDAYGGSDFASIEADNTSAFNCRPVSGGSGWSQHAYGRAIDVNPIENPYVSASGTTEHRASRPFLDRTRHRPGMAWAGGALVGAFSAQGWGWGGSWSGARDYQHFSATGH
jgi:D-alanyl-D-alanine carboxypeptidase